MPAMKTLENIPLDSDDDVEEEPTIAKKETVRPLHNLPGISLETKQTYKPEKRLSLSEIFEKMSIKPMAALRDKTDNQKQAANDEDLEKPETNEEINRENEGDFGDSGEINLDRPVHLPAESLLVAAESEDVSLEAEHPEEEHPIEEELLATGLGAEGPPEPPETPPPGGTESESNPPEPEPTPRVEPVRAAPSPGRPWYNAAAADTMRVDHQRELDDTAYYAEKRGVRRGLGTGLLFGWMFGKRGKKKQALAFKKDLNNKDKQITNLQNNQAKFNQRIDTLANAHKQDVNNKVNLPPDKFVGNVGIDKAPKKYVERVGNVIKAIPQPVESVTMFKELPSIPLNEKARKIANFVPLAAAVESAPALKDIVSAQLEHIEQQSYVEHYKESYSPPVGLVEQQDKKGHNNESYRPTLFKTNAIEQVPKVAKVEALTEEQPIAEVLYEVPEGTKVEVSAWHRIELDQKTGKPVSKPEVAYGEEFRQEQRQEVWREDKGRRATKPRVKPDVKVNGGGAMAGQLGGLATASFGSSSSKGAYPTAGSPANSTAMQSVKALSPEQEHIKHLNAGGELLRHASSPIVWAAAVVIVVILFLLGILR